VRAGGPLLALLGFLVLPLVWAVPEAMIAAELSTCFPENSGYDPRDSLPARGGEVPVRQLHVFRQAPEALPTGTWRG
jgi:hypothetical protein